MFNAKIFAVMALVCLQPSTKQPSQEMDVDDLEPKYVKGKGDERGYFLLQPLRRHEHQFAVMANILLVEYIFNETRDRERHFAGLTGTMGSDALLLCKELPPSKLHSCCGYSTL